MSMVRSVIFDIIGRDNASRAFLTASAAAKKAATEVEAANYRMIASGAKLQARGQKMTKSVTLPLVALGTAAVYESAKYAKGLNTIAVATDESVANMAKLSTGIKGLATETGTSLSQLTEGAYIAAKTFHKPADALNVLAAATKGAKAEGVDLHTGVTALTSVMASYGLKAKDATKVENEMIRASGLAKTTFADFAGSLSTVIPLAGSLGISFAQIGGAIATMTQHGETAQNATQNLGNLITNLAGQNNVASQAMQQLGINTIDLQKHLGTRGLTGTLNVVLGAMKNAGHDGMVTYTTFKQSALGVDSLHLAMGKMTGAALTNSKALLAGKMSLQDYKVFARNLADGQGNLTMQFLTGYRAFTGFNNLLKSGKGNTQTYAKYLQTALGGVTGLKTALMLLGPEFAKSAGSGKLFTDNVGAIKKVADGANTSILGWKKTQGLLSTQFDITKQKLMVFLVNLGDKLAPIAARAVDWLGKIVDFLSSATKGFGGTALTIALVVTALGPLLAIAGRVIRVLGLLRLAFYALGGFGRGMMGMSANAAMVGTSLERTSTAAFRMGTRFQGAAAGMRGMGGAMKGLLAVGAGFTAAQTVGSGGGAGGWIGSILGGGALGFALSGGNPIAGAIGAISGAISHGVSMWHAHKDAAQQALQAEKAWVDQLTGAIAADNGAIGANTRSMVAHQLQKDGILDKAQGLHIDLGTILNGALGKGGAALSKAINGPENALIARNNANAAKISALQADSPANLAMDQAKRKQMISTLLSQNTAIQKQIHLYDGLRTALAKDGIDIGKSIKAYHQQEQTLNAGRKSTGNYANQINELRHKLSTAVDYNGQFSKSLKGSSVEATHNRETFKNLTQAAIVDAKAVEETARKHESLAQATAAGNAVLRSHVKDIMAAAVAAGFDKKQLVNLLASLGVLDTTKAKPKVTLLDDATPKVPNIQNAINSIQGKTVTVTIDTVNNLSSTTRSQVPINPKTGKPYARGGKVKDGWFTVGEEGYELGHKSGSRIDFYSHAQSKAMTGLARVPGFAGGTGITHSGNDWIYGGIKYGSQRAAQNAQYRANHHAKPTKGDWNTAIGGLTGAFTNNGSTRSEFESATKALLKLARAAGVASKTLGTMTGESRRLDRMAGQRDRLRTRLGTGPTPSTAFDRLDSLRSARAGEFSSVRGAITGTFSAASAGVRNQVYTDKPAPKISAGTILTDLTKAANRARRFAATLIKLGKLHLPGFMIRQLAEAGPDALPQALALAQSSRSQLAAFRKEGAVLDRAGTRAGNFQAGRMFDARIEKAHKRVLMLQKQIRTLNREIYNLGLKLENQGRHAAGFGPDAKHHHHKAHHAHHHKAHHGRHHHPGAKHHDAGVTVNVFPSADMDEVALAVAVGRRVQAHLGAS